METLMEQEEECTVTEEMLDISQLCRVCANPNEYLIPIFHGEGLEHDLKSKVSRHLPLQIRESDSLPVQLCYQCASTLIAWSDLVEGCSEADEKLRSMLPEGAQAEVTLDDKTGLPINEESFGLQSSAVSAKVLHAETSEAVANAEVIVEPDVSSMDEEAGAIEPAQQRCSESFKQFHLSQMRLKNQPWKSNGAMFCFHCGETFMNSFKLLEHLNIDHKTKCEYCGASFVNERQLLKHIVVHNNKEFIVNKNRSDTKRNKSVNLSRICAKRYSAKRKNTRCPQSLLQTKPVTSVEYKLQCEFCSLTYSCQLYKKHLSACRLKTSKEDDRQNKEEDYFKEKTNTADCIEFNDSEISEDKVQCFLTDTSKKYISTDNRGFQLDQKNEEEAHQKQPLDDKVDFGFSCKVCNNSYKRHYDMLRHFRKKHPEQKWPENSSKSIDGVSTSTVSEARVEIDGSTMYKCKLCGKLMKQRQGFAQHLRTHTKERPYMCPQCGKQFSTHRSWQRHIRDIHEQRRPFQCDVCGQRFKAKDLCMSHRRTHTGERPYMCDICGKSFHSRNSIYIHQRTHTDNFPHVCETCGRKFRTKQNLTHHTRTHTGEKPYSCGICSKSFKDQGSVKRHRQTHTGDKLFVCSFPSCGSSFAHNRYLKVHLKKHLKSTESGSVQTTNCPVSAPLMIL